MTKGFSSQSDLTEKTIILTEAGSGLWAFTAEGAPNSAAIAPGRGDALAGREMVDAALASTRDFVERTYRPAAGVAAKGDALEEAWEAVRASREDKFRDYAIHEHRPSFNLARAFDEARDKAMWEALQG